MRSDGSMDLSEEEMEQSVSGLLFALDSASVAPPLQLTNSALTATFRGDTTAWGNYGDQAGEQDFCTHLPQVCGNVTIHRGQYYWEVDVCNSALYRIGIRSLDGNREWWFERRGSAFHAVFDGRHELLPSVPPQLKTVGMFLNVGGFSLTFHNPLTQELLTAIPSHFTPPLCPAFQLGQGRLKLRPGLPPPSHVFLSCSSAYRGPRGAGRGHWRRDVAFGSVRSVIQRFEEMATSDSDSGLMSSYSSSSQASLPEPSPETTA
ncbi:E3 ubiquitin-protein ligase Midline-1 isoform X2 [Brachyhypopomus gauderio]